MTTTIAILIAVAVLLFVLELFVPSGGLIGVLAAACVIGALVLLFQISMEAGLIGSTVAAVLIPIFAVVMLRMFPRTPFGKRLMLSQGHSTLGKDLKLDPVRDADPQSLVGALGEAVTACRPVGICRFGDKRIECLSISGTLDPGVKVRVVSVAGIEVKVQAA